MNYIAIDATGDAAATVRGLFGHIDILFWYGTGSTGIQWTTADIALFPESAKFEIDQGGAGAPVLTARIRDVESGAWGPGQAVDRTGWDVWRPMLYTARDTLPSILADGWRGDLWLAWPGWAGETLPAAPGCNYVAVQNNWRPSYDQSVVLDSTWFYPIGKGSEMLSGMLQPGDYVNIPVPAGTFHGVMFYRNYTPAGTKAPIRVELHSVSSGAIVAEPEITNNNPVTYRFPKSDVDTIMLHVGAALNNIGYTLF